MPRICFAPNQHGSQAVLRAFANDVYNLLTRLAEGIDMADHHNAIQNGDTEIRFLQLREALPEWMSLRPEDLAERLPSGGSKFVDRTQWATLATSSYQVQQVSCRILFRVCCIDDNIAEPLTEPGLHNILDLKDDPT